MLLRSLLIITLLQASACSYLRGEDGVFRDRKYDYRKAQDAERIVLPDGYTDAAIIDYYPVPAASPYADKELIINPPLPRGLAIDVNNSVRLQRLADKEWVLIKATPSQVWPRLKAYAQSQGMMVFQENGAKGQLLLSTSQGAYHFRLLQGFQQNYSELAVRFSPNPADVVQWSENSHFTEVESEQLIEIARFLSLTESPVYSYVAHNISVEKRLFAHYDEQGKRYVLLNADRQRAFASLQKALSDTEFTELEESSIDNGFDVQYTPQSSKTKKPGFWKRLFRIKPKPYDDGIEYAGLYYRLTVSKEGQFQRIDIEKIRTDKKQSAENLKKELNQQLQAIMGLLL